eukprot:751648-Hanusia_phi.AAC.7
MLILQEQTCEEQSRSGGWSRSMQEQEQEPEPETSNRSGRGNGGRGTGRGRDRGDEEGYSDRNVNVDRLHRRAGERKVKKMTG